MITEHNDELQQYTILLNDPHGEYTGCLKDLPNFDEAIGMASWVRCNIIWDGYALQTECHRARRKTEEGIGDMMAFYNETDRRVNEAFRTMFADTLDDILDFQTPDGATIWSISGRMGGLERAFRTLFDSLNRAPSGDDDFFDYWPNTMDMLYAFASDMDELDENGAYRAEVADMAQRIWLESTDGGAEGETDNANEWGHLTRWPNPTLNV